MIDRKKRNTTLGHPVIPLSNCLLPTNCHGPLLIVGSGCHHLPSEIIWSGDIIVLCEDSTQRDFVHNMASVSNRTFQVPDASWDSSSIPLEDNQVAGAILLPFGPLPEPSELKRIVAEAGFVLSLDQQRWPPDGTDTLCWTVHNDAEGDLRLIDFNNGQALTASRQQLKRRWRLVPPFLLKKFMPPRVCLSSRRPATTRLSAILAEASALLPDESCESTLVQVKDKLTVPFTRHAQRKHILKIPLSARSTEGLDNAVEILGKLHESLPRDHMLRDLLPRIHSRIEVEGVQGIIEEARTGHPLAMCDHDEECLAVFPELTELMKTMANLPESALLGPEDHDTSYCTESLSLLTQQYASECSETLARVFTLVNTPTSHRFLRKGDFSLNNVLVLEGKLSGLIDWDESGTTNHRLANLADFFMSWMWQRDHFTRDKSLALLISGNLDPLESGLDMGSVLKQVGGTRRELALGALQAWIDHAYHELKHPQIRIREKRVASLLIAPLQALEPLLSALES